MDPLTVPFSLVRAGDSMRAHCVVVRCYVEDPTGPFELRPYRFDIDLRSEASRTAAANAIVEAVPGLSNQFNEVRKAIYLMSCGYDTSGPLDVSKYVEVARESQEPPPPEGFKIISAADLIEDQPQLKPVVIDGLLRRGEIMNIVAAPKTGKSWAVHDLAMAVVTGGAWFNHPCAQGRVLLIDNELHPQTLSVRLDKVAEARGLTHLQLHDRLDIVSLRGALKDILEMGALFEYIKRNHYALLIVDSLYRALPSGVDENSNVDITRIYNLLDQVAGHTGAAIAIVHHTSKGTQAGKSITDVGAGAGAQARAADTHLTLRPHAEDGVVVLDAVVRSFKPLPPTCWRFELPHFTPEPDLNPTDLLTARRRRKDVAETKPAADAPSAPAVQAVMWTPQLFVERILTDTPAIMDQVYIAAQAHGLSLRETKRLLNLAMIEGLVSKTGGFSNTAARYGRAVVLNTNA